jgi:hypothetical protein
MILIATGFSVSPEGAETLALLDAPLALDDEKVGRFRNCLRKYAVVIVERYC